MNANKNIVHTRQIVATKTGGQLIKNDDRRPGFRGEQRDGKIIRHRSADKTTVFSFKNT